MSSSVIKELKGLDGRLAYTNFAVNDDFTTFRSRGKHLSFIFIFINLTTTELGRTLK